MEAVLYNRPNREVLDTFEVGDRVWLNGGGKCMRVVGVSSNFFIVYRRPFSLENFAICSKGPANISLDDVEPDLSLCGFSTDLNHWYDRYNFTNKAWVRAFLCLLEKDEVAISPWLGYSLESIKVKKNWKRVLFSGRSN